MITGIYSATDKQGNVHLVSVKLGILNPRKRRDVELSQKLERGAIRVKTDWPSCKVKLHYFLLR